MKYMTKDEKQPLVSVIMPAYNCEDYIADALQSIIDQTYKNLEIIVVDDASTDGTWTMIQALAKQDKRIVALQNPQNLKIVGTLNRAVNRSKGKYLARMDGDDIREPDSINREVAFLEKHPDVVVVGGAAEFCDQQMNTLNKRAYPTSDQAIRSKIFRYSPFCHASIVIRAEAAGKDPYQYNWAEDYDLYFRLAQKGKMANLPDVLYRVRTHKASVSRSKTRYQEKLTLYIRLKAVMEYGFSMTFSDKAYFAAQLATMYLMPSGFRFWLFNKLRAS